MQIWWTYGKLFHSFRDSLRTVNIFHIFIYLIYIYYILQRTWEASAWNCEGNGNVAVEMEECGDARTMRKVECLDLKELKTVVMYPTGSITEDSGLPISFIAEIILPGC